MSESALRDSQLQMARFLRNPEHEPAPVGVEQRRLEIYQDLIYNNIEGFISGGFPILRSLYSDEHWHQLVRVFIEGHRCHSPYFLEISQEFLNFLMQDFVSRDCDPPFMGELAHYEWVELALDVAEQDLPRACGSSAENALSGIPVLSPLAWVLKYQYPVHKIGPDFQPESAREPTYLAVYRDRSDAVRFMELNGATARLLELVRDNTDLCGEELLQQLATEMGMPNESVLNFGTDLLGQFIDLSIISHCLPK